MLEYDPVAIRASESELVTVGLRQRIGAFLETDPLNNFALEEAIQQSCDGQWGVISGVYGTFNGDHGVVSDRTAIDNYFTVHRRHGSILNGHAARDFVASFGGQKVDGAMFNGEDGDMCTSLIAARRRFAVDSLATETDAARRTVWLPASDNRGALPLWRRVSAPLDHVPANETIVIGSDHIILPNLGGYYTQHAQANA